MTKAGDDEICPDSSGGMGNHVRGTDPEGSDVVSEYCNTVWDYLLSSEETADSDTWRFLNDLDEPTPEELEAIELEENEEE